VAHRSSLTSGCSVVDEASAQLPAEIAVGHRVGDDPGLARRPLQVRTKFCGLHRLRVAVPGTRRHVSSPAGGPLIVATLRREDAALAAAHVPSRRS
jgi:hypothetical protein